MRNGALVDVADRCLRWAQSAAMKYLMPRTALAAAILALALAACGGPSESTWTYNPVASGSPNPLTQESPGPAGAPGGVGATPAASGGAVGSSQPSGGSSAP